MLIAPTNFVSDLNDLYVCFKKQDFPRDFIKKMKHSAAKGTIDSTAISKFLDSFRKVYLQRDFCSIKKVTVGFLFRYSYLILDLKEIIFLKVVQEYRVSKLGVEILSGKLCALCKEVEIIQDDASEECKEAVLKLMQGKEVDLSDNNFCKDVLNLTIDLLTKKKNLGTKLVAEIPGEFSIDCKEALIKSMQDGQVDFSDITLCSEVVALAHQLDMDEFLRNVLQPSIDDISKNIAIFKVLKKIEFSFHWKDRLFWNLYKECMDCLLRSASNQKGKFTKENDNDLENLATHFDDGLFNILSNPEWRSGLKMSANTLQLELAKFLDDTTKIQKYMQNLKLEQRAFFVLDSDHPFLSDVLQNLKNACVKLLEIKGTFKENSLKVLQNYLYSSDYNYPNEIVLTCENKEIIKKLFPYTQKVDVIKIRSSTFDLEFIQGMVSTLRFSKPYSNVYIEGFPSKASNFNEECLNVLKEAPLHNVCIYLINTSVEDQSIYYYEGKPSIKLEKNKKKH